jgi:hypothetical protein
MEGKQEYTKVDINFNINKLEDEIEDLRLHRTELSQSINSKEKQVLAWKELDLSQMKMF